MNEQETDQSLPNEQEETEPSVLVAEGDQLSIIGASLSQLPLDLGEKYGQATKQLDLSYNSLIKIENLDKFTRLASLVLDNNKLDSIQDFPRNEKMQTLWVNNNNISDLRVFLDCITNAYPNLTYLSMLKNPACPNYFTGKDFEDYKRYRYYVLYRLKKLKFLDSSPVTDFERKEAARVGPYMITAKPDESQYQQPKEKPKDQTENLPMLPNELQPEGKGSARFGISSYVYYGKHSEGNRFIVNEDL